MTLACHKTLDYAAKNARFGYSAYPNACHVANLCVPRTCCVTGDMHIGAGSVQCEHYCMLRFHWLLQLGSLSLSENLLSATLPSSWGNIKVSHLARSDLLQPCSENLLPNLLDASCCIASWQMSDEAVNVADLGCTIAKPQSTCGKPTRLVEQSRDGKPKHLRQIDTLVGRCTRATDYSQCKYRVNKTCIPCYLDTRCQRSCLH